MFELVEYQKLSRTKAKKDTFLIYGLGMLCEAIERNIQYTLIPITFEEKHEISDGSGLESDA